MKLYYNPGTPEGYEPPAFRAAEPEESYAHPMDNVSIGCVDTNFHRYVLLVVCLPTTWRTAIPSVNLDVKARRGLAHEMPIKKEDAVVHDSQMMDVNEHLERMEINKEAMVEGTLTCSIL